MFTVLFLLPLLGSATVYAEKPMGYLAPDTPGILYSIESPRGAQTLPLLNAPEGEKVGTAKVSEGYFGLCLTPVSFQGKQFGHYPSPDTIVLNKHDYQPAGDCSHYTYYEVHDGYARILSRTLNGGTWIRLDNVPAGGDDLKIVLEPTGFLDGIERISPRDIIGYHHHRLRSQPSLDAEVLVTLGSTRIIHQFTGKVQNGWAEAVVWEMSRALVLPCTSNDEYHKAATGRRWVGWVRLLDENGEPDGISFEAQTC